MILWGWIGIYAYENVMSFGLFLQNMCCEVRKEKSARVGVEDSASSIFGILMRDDCIGASCCSGYLAWAIG